MGFRRALSTALVLSLILWIGLSSGATVRGGFSLVTSASAQEAEHAAITEEDYVAWERVAKRAEESLANHRASGAAFEELRNDLADWRSRFLTEQNRNSDQISTLKNQIEALGPVPEEGQSESPELAARRAQLEEEYNTLVAPALKAREAHARANGLISRFDSLLRTRQQEQFLQRGPSPIFPSTLIAAGEELHTVFRILVGEIRSSATLRSDITQFRQNLLQITILLGLSLLLLIRGRTWFRKLVIWIMRRGGRDGALVGAMVLSLGQVILPVIGVILLVAALMSTRMLGPNGENLLLSVTGMGIAFFFARWLGGQIFPKMENWPTPLDLSARERVRGRFYSSSLGVLFAAAILIKRIGSLFTLSVETQYVLGFPVIILASICLFGLAKLLISHGAKEATEAPEDGFDDPAGDERSFVDRTIWITGRACRVFAVAAPLASLAGYTPAAVYLSLSPALTLTILAMVSFLQTLSMEIFGWIGGEQKTRREGLFPVLVNFALIVGATPFIALSWGVRRADLEELWVNLQEGFLIGDTRISLTVLVVFGIAFFAGILVTRLVQAAFRASVLPRTRIDPGGQKAVVSGLGYLGLFVSAMIAVSAAGLDLSNLAIVAGALSVGVGFGLQNIVSNFVSGLILLIERPVTEGDWVEVGGVMGTVRKISVRATTIETFDRNNVVVPNSDFVSSQVTNWTRGNLTGRLILPVGVAYGSDTRRVAQILQEIAEAHPLVIVNPPPLIVFQGFGADSLDFEMRVILRDINFGLGTRTELNHQIAERFAQEGIEIPFAQRDIWLRNPEALNRPPPVGTPMPMGPPRPDPDPEFPESPTEDDT